MEKIMIGKNVDTEKKCYIENCCNFNSENITTKANALLK